MKDTKLTVTNELTAPLNDLFGIFFEDINHAADGGLYAEMVQNRSFEFAPIDNSDYQATTAWELSDPQSLRVADKDPLNTKNLHYLTVDAKQTATITNAGFNSGMFYQQGEQYNFSFFVKALNGTQEVTVQLTDDSGKKIAAPQSITVESHQWLKYSAQFTAEQTTTTGRLVLTFPEGTRILVDMISLFPKNTFNHRPNYVRADLGETLKDLHPKFLRFPGGCLVHDGQLDPDNRGAMYRWKNSIGPVEQRPARRNNWGYNQTLGLGYFEYFELSEDIGAEPLPVLPGAHDPHHDREAPIAQLGDWIDDALDLIEFANGSENSKWGKVRVALGHPKPFNLKYLAIGNEEVGQAFFDRYPYFHKAIKAKYPNIKLINTSGPFAAGAEFERGWKSARENHSDLVDEHYYTAPTWFLANQHRYDSYDPKGPKAFIGEYASKKNQWYNAVVEASYMTGLERNADKVGLACYAPLFCNVDYKDWTPDLIFFNQSEVSPSVNYYVQQLFMKYQGTNNVDYHLANVPEAKVIDDGPLNDGLSPQADGTDVKFENIRLTANGQTKQFKGQSLSEKQTIRVGSTDADDYEVAFDVTKVGDEPKGAHFCFGEQDLDNTFTWVLGGWGNTDSMIRTMTNGMDTDWTQTSWTMNKNQTYHCQIKVSGRHITTWIDGEKMNEIEIPPFVVQPMYTNLTYDKKASQYYFKAVNVTDKQQEITLDTDLFADGSLYQLTGLPDAENHLGMTNQIERRNVPFSGHQFILPPYSVSALMSTKQFRTQ
ncbi:alpha-L-arabinofuranosidase C-terminal domain-containing protein [Lentilactobacillus buchneri]|uniref:alpha-L-arabinofuranosidase C-terminal domain-containing protein n=1 Tax=Lentilactobacillus buchneri TaxID=1581 RepID=UPI0012921CD7|nr:alpha-L-arabinofuranosidase C-terminal domain-containing protein [Lentilactobacillus buchneri]MQM61236.1 alpha-N-arabinofuranosidase [Lentilactobacillus buchneri]MQM80991.1 alpha-N-arabinofuranosidase [Lentilactobacillus buchneri]